MVYEPNLNSRRDFGHTYPYPISHLEFHLHGLVEDITRFLPAFGSECHAYISGSSFVHRKSVNSTASMEKLPRANASHLPSGDHA